MNESHLSDRLIRVANFVPTGMTVADIGSDHAYLPSYLCLQKQTPFAIAGEVNEGPYQSALSQVVRSGLQSQISVRKGNGLAVISPGEVDVITIAGMGGGLIATILDEGKSKLDGVKRLVLQPNVSADLIRKWLRENNWFLHAEDILEEDGKIYEILVAVPGDDRELYLIGEEKKLLLGPYLLKEMSEPFQKKWKSELENWKRILTQFEQAKESNEKLKQKRLEFEELIKMVEEVLS